MLHPRKRTLRRRPTITLLQEKYSLATIAKAFGRRSCSNKKMEYGVIQPVECPGGEPGTGSRRSKKPRNRRGFPKQLFDARACQSGRLYAGISATRPW